MCARSFKSFPTSLSCLTGLLLSSWASNDQRRSSALANSGWNQEACRGSSSLVLGALDMWSRIVWRAEAVKAAAGGMSGFFVLSFLKGNFLNVLFTLNRDSLMEEGLWNPYFFHIWFYSRTSNLAIHFSALNDFTIRVSMLPTVLVYILTWASYLKWFWQFSTRFQSTLHWQNVKNSRAPDAM